MNATMTENKLIRQLTEKYRSNGFEIVPNPWTAGIAEALGNYRPDLIVRKGDRNLVLEVKDSIGNLSVERIREIAEKVNRMPGRRFLLVTGQDESPPDPEHGDELPSREQVVEWLARADRLLRLEEPTAAFLTLAAAWEAILRKQAFLLSLGTERLPLSVVVKTLYTQGELSPEQFERSLAMIETRNHMVHRSSSGSSLDERALVDNLRNMIGALLSEWEGI